jgi:glycosyltransferase involved in cell wall biosynthesis
MSLAAARGSHVAKSEMLAAFAIEATALYESADLLLPNSQMEADQLIRDLGVTTPIRIVPNAVDPGLFPPGAPWNERDGVLYVGRIEPHKNQLGLIRALKGTGVRLRIVGGAHPDHPEYAEAVRAEADGFVEMVGHVDHAHLKDYYGRALVHACPSMFETTGLVSLEAALSGCNVVSTVEGYAREYLQDLATYCDPHNETSIREAVFAALSLPQQTRLRERILDNYTWEHTAAATAAAYHDLLEYRLEL